MEFPDDRDGGVDGNQMQAHDAAVLDYSAFVSHEQSTCFLPNGPWQANFELRTGAQGPSTPANIASMGSPSAFAEHQQSTGTFENGPWNEHLELDSLHSGAQANYPVTPMAPWMSGTPTAGVGSAPANATSNAPVGENTPLRTSLPFGSPSPTPRLPRFSFSAEDFRDEDVGPAAVEQAPTEPTPQHSPSTRKNNPLPSYHSSPDILTANEPSHVQTPTIAHEENGHPVYESLGLYGLGTRSPIRTPIANITNKRREPDTPTAKNPTKRPRRTPATTTITNGAAANHQPANDGPGTALSASELRAIIEHPQGVDTSTYARLTAREAVMAEAERYLAWYRTTFVTLPEESWDVPVPGNVSCLPFPPKLRVD